MGGALNVFEADNTGKSKLVDTAGRVDKFRSKYADFNKPSDVKEDTPIDKKEETSEAKTAPAEEPAAEAPAEEPAAEAPADESVPEESPEDKTDSKE